MRIPGVTWYPGMGERLDDDIRTALEQTGAEVVRDLRASHTLPWAEDSAANRRRGVVPGELSEKTFVDRTQSAKGRVSIVSDTPYARRLYYHPEFRFYQGTNEAAGAMWFEPYKAGGTKHRFARDAFGKLLKARRSR